MTSLRSRMLCSFPYGRRSTMRAAQYSTWIRLTGTRDSSIYEHILMVASLIQFRRVAAAAEEQVEELAEIFKVLADPTRLKILAALADERSLCVHELCDRLGMSQPAVSH